MNNTECPYLVCPYNDTILCLNCPYVESDEECDESCTVTDAKLCEDCPYKDNK